MAAARTSARPFLAFASLWASRLSLNYNWAITGAILPALYHGLPASAWQIAVVVAATPVGQGVAEVPGGLLAIRTGSRKVALLGTTLLGLCAALSAGSTNWVMLTGLRFGLGVGSGMFWPSSLALIRTVSPSQGFPTAVGVYNASGAFGVLSGLVGGLALASAFGWRFSLLVGGLLQLALSAAVWITVRENSKPAARAARANPPSQGRSILRSRSLWALTLAGSGVWGLAYILPQYSIAFAAADHPFWNLGLVALFVSIASLIGIPAGIVGGVLVSRFGRSRAFLAASALVMAGVALGFPVFGFESAVGLLVAFGVADGVAFTMLYSIPSQLAGVGPKDLPLAVGMLDSVETLAGSGLVVAFGLLIGFSGFRVAWWIAGLVAALPLALLIWVRERNAPSDVGGMAS
jgi:MFS family permease